MGMVPEFLPVVAGLTDLRCHLQHHVDDELCRFSAFFAVFDRDTVFDHLLDVPSIFRNYQLVPQ